MKLKFTQAKKARRASGFHKSGSNKSTSEKRRLLREKPQPKTFGLQVGHIQRVLLKKDTFGTPIYKLIKHAAPAFRTPKKEIQETI